MSERQPATRAASGESMTAEWTWLADDYDTGSAFITDDPYDGQRSIAGGLSPQMAAGIVREHNGIVRGLRAEAAAREPALDVERLRAALKEMIAHDAEQYDNCGDWGTNPCLIRERARRTLEAKPELEEQP